MHQQEKPFKKYPIMRINLLITNQIFNYICFHFSHKNLNLSRPISWGKLSHQYRHHSHCIPIVEKRRSQVDT